VNIDEVKAILYTRM